MADAIVRGEIDGVNDAEFRTSLTCSRGVPSGSIRGEIEIRSAGRDTDYTFRSTSPTSIVARRAGVTRYVRVVFRRVRLINQRTGFTINNAQIVLLARTLANGRRRATLTIFRPGRTTFRSSGVLEDGRVFVARNVSCQR